MSGHNTPYHMYQGPLGLVDPGDGGTIVPNGYGQICELVTAGAETRVLGVPAKAGIRFALRMTTDGGDAVVTAAATLNETGNTVATFDAVGEMLDLISVTDAGVIRWEILENVGSVGLA